MNTKKIRSFSQGTSGKDFIRLNKVTVSQMSKKAKKPIVSSHKYFQTTIRATSPKMITKNSDLDEHASQQEDLISPIMSPVTEQESQNEELNEGVRQKFEINRLNMEAPIDEILASLQTYKSVELPPTPPNHPPSSIVYKPENEINYSGSSNRETPLKSDDPLFRNVDYSGMPLSEQIKRSARRVIINENGDEVSDRTWTEVKLRLNSHKKDLDLQVTPFHINQNDSAMRIEIMTQADSEDYECMTPRMDQKEIGCQTEKKENEIHIRRSARLAKKRKTMTEMKRKHKEISKGLSSSYLRGSSRRKKE